MTRWGIAFTTINRWVIDIDTFHSEASVPLSPYQWSRIENFARAGRQADISDTEPAHNAQHFITSQYKYNQHIPAKRRRTDRPVDRRTDRPTL